MTECCDIDADSGKGSKHHVYLNDQVFQGLEMGRVTRRGKSRISTAVYNSKGALFQFQR